MSAYLRRIFLLFLLLGFVVPDTLTIPIGKTFAYSKKKKKKHKKKKKKKKKRSASYRKKRKKAKKRVRVKITYKTPVERKYYHPGHWAKDVLRDLTTEEKIGQLFMVAAYSNRGPEHVNQIANLIEKYNIGGLLFFQGGPLRQAALTNYYQSISKVPLLIAIDGEWGVSMRLDSTIAYPKHMTLGAIQQDELIYRLASRIAAECQRLGIQVDFAPDIDINSNPSNPVIGFRSFGQDKYNVAAKGIAFMYGLQDNNVIAVGKHFPGHGDTDVDSHKALPMLNLSPARLDTVELHPFRELMAEGLTGIMVAHLNLPLLDSTNQSSASLSPAIVKGLLRDSLDFKGLSFTDALDMKGVANLYAPGEVDLKALLAGNDVLLNSENVPKAVELIKTAIDSCLISIEEIDEHVKKILLAKQWTGVSEPEEVQLKDLHEDLNAREAKALNKRLFGASLTLLNNRNHLLPLKGLDTLKIATLILGEKEIGTFQKTVDKYALASHFNLPRKPAQLLKDSVLHALKNYNLVLVSFEDGSRKIDNNFNLTDDYLEILYAVSQQSRVVFHVMAPPYCLGKIPAEKMPDALIMSYEENEYTEAHAAELIFGARNAPGKLPVAVLPHYAIGSGFNQTPVVRLVEEFPEELGLDLKYLTSIDSLVQDAIARGAFPGAQVFAAKDGKIFLTKSFGTMSYEDKTPVSETTLYDIASITKIAASTNVMMKLYEEKKFKPDESFSKYLPELNGSNKSGLTFREQLSHMGRLKPYLPFYLETIDSTGPKISLYRHAPDSVFTIRLTDSLWAKKNLSDSLYLRIIESAPEPIRKYQYSDMGYYFIKRFAERAVGKPFEKQADYFYEKLGMQYTGYLPLRKFSPLQIAPTENDLRFRGNLLRGYVHDQGAALMGGVAGHAGLFSTASDLGKLFQMYLNKGSYGGENYFEASTIKEFTRCQFPKENNRRGMGFDKPETDPKKDSPCSKFASPESFGHSGFTGTFAWADPKYNLVYVFLSNRVHPDAGNKKIIELSVRTKIQDLLYRAIKKAGREKEQEEN
ncbi:MAG: glycoside hydrolase family 3 N-terminal domain-containing protein [Bacteroidota bacterium]